MTHLKSLEPVTLGGTAQWLFIHGDTRNPLLLWLHGGPGSADIATAAFYGRALTEHFLVVHWDQRGSGKSGMGDAAPLTIERLAEDAQELTIWLLHRFGQPDLYLVGHSWGSALGLVIARRVPELIRAFAGVGQLISGGENERRSFEIALALAHTSNNLLAVRQLRRNPPPYGDNVSALLAQRTWLFWLGGFFYQRARALPYALKLLASGSYTLHEKLLHSHHLRASLRRLWPEVERMNLLAEAPHLSAPLLFCLGRHDAVTPSELAVRYLNTVDAPKKRLVWFERSAHCPHLEEPERFASALASQLVRFS